MKKLLLVLLCLTAGPALAYFITYRMCLGLQRRDAAVIGHGVESGVIKRLRGEGKITEEHLAQALKQQGKADEAAKYQAKFEMVWAKADTKIKSSCLCQDGVTMAK